MVTRIVKMSFEKSNAALFLEIFNEHREQIRAAEGCTYLELWQTEENDSTLFFTHSRWDSEEHLNKLAAVTPPGTKYREDIKLLGDRIRMLYDVQWTIEQLDAELLELMRATN